MKLAVLVVNANDFLTPNCRESLAAAADRWGAAFVEHVPLPSRNHPSYEKWLRLATGKRPWDRVAVFDADATVRSDAPSIFAAAPEPGVVYAVPDLAADRWPAELRADARERNYAHWFDRLAAAGLPPTDRDACLDGWLNSGVAVVSPREHAAALLLFAKFHRVLADGRASAWCEQALWNYCLRATGTPTAELGETWNYLSPPLQDEPQRECVYHFTGPDAATQKPRAAAFTGWRSNTSGSHAPA